MTKKTSLLVLCLVSATVFFAACGAQSASQSSSENGTIAADQKTGTTTRTGKVIKIGDKYFLEQMGKEALEIDSYTLDLGTYMGTTVTATGQYSGNTLFIGKIE